MTRKPFTVKLDTELIENFKRTCKKMGITPTAAIKLFMTECVRDKEIPFHPKLKK